MTREDLWNEISADPIGTYEAHRGPCEVDFLRMVPEHCQEGLVRYVLLGVPPGRFLRAVLSNEFEQAERLADIINQGALPAYRQFLEHGCPPECWGSPDKVRTWVEQHESRKAA